MQSRIKCVPCGNRVFSNREALQQHLKTSSSYHPSCDLCDKRFSSESGLDSHKAATHPPTFDCVRCDRKFNHLFALEDHYRGSPNHPNCLRCGKGFKDIHELEAHRNTAHRQVPCSRCDGELVYQDQDSLERHYTLSENHPNCHICGKGCADPPALEIHFETTHSAAPSNSIGDKDGIDNVLATSSLTTSATDSRTLAQAGHGPSGSYQPPRVEKAAALPPAISPSAAVGAEGVPSLRPPPANGQTTSPSPHPQNASLRNVAIARNASISRSDALMTPHPYASSSGFNPLTPFKESSVLGGSRTDTPDLRLSMAFSSPLLQVQPLQFSPVVGLAPPGREMNALWNSTKNVQVTTPPAVSPSQNGAAPAQPSLYSSRERSASQSTTSSSYSASANSVYQTPPSSSGPSPLPFSSRLDQSSPPSRTIPTRIPRTHSYSASLGGGAASHGGPAVPSINAHGYGTSSRRSLGSSPTQPTVGSGSRVRFDMAPSRSSTLTSLSFAQSPSNDAGSAAQDSLLPRNLSPPFHFTDSRLYPGLARATLQTSTMSNPPSATTARPTGYFGPSTPPRSAESGRHSWRQFETEDRADVFSRTLQYLMPDSTLDNTSGHGSFDEFDTSTPKVIGSPKKEPEAFVNVFESPNGNLSSDTLEFVSGDSESEAEPPELGIDSSPGSVTSHSSSEPSSYCHLSVSGLRIRDAEEDEGETGAYNIEESAYDPLDVSDLPDTTPEWLLDSGTPGPSPAPAISFSASMESANDHSPEVDSPVGLATLPSISPLLHTPNLDLVGFDLPEAKIPLPESASNSPILAPLDAQESVTIEASSIESLALDTSPRVEVGVQASDEMDGEIASPIFSKDGTDCSVVSNATSPVSVTRIEDLAAKQDLDGSSTEPIKSAPLSPLHCRECKSDPCDDITATMCGHIFCNRCITNAVIKTSRCPLCSTPTLLYCLFRLDLETS